jgi:hypothetical protein
MTGFTTPTSANAHVFERFFPDAHLIGVDHVHGYDAQATASTLDTLDTALVDMGYPEGMGGSVMVASSMGSLALFRYLEAGGIRPGWTILESPVAEQDSIAQPTFRYLPGGYVTGGAGFAVTALFSRMGPAPALDAVAASPQGLRIRRRNVDDCRTFALHRAHAFADQAAALARIPAMVPMGAIGHRAGVMLQGSGPEALLDPKRAARSVLGHTTDTDLVVITDGQHANEFMDQPLATAAALRARGIPSVASRL